MTVTRRDQLVLAILPREFYESIVETLDILGDPEMVKVLPKVSRISSASVFQ